MIKAVDYEGRTFLMHAAGTPKPAECFKRASPEAETSDGSPPSKQTKPSDASKPAKPSSSPRGAVLGGGQGVSGGGSIAWVQNVSQGATVTQAPEPSPVSGENDGKRSESDRGGVAESGTPATGERKDRASVEEACKRRERKCVVIFKTAFNFMTEFLWKEQVRQRAGEPQALRAPECTNGHIRSRRE